MCTEALARVFGTKDTIESHPCNCFTCLEYSCRSVTLLSMPAKVVRDAIIDSHKSLTRRRAYPFPDMLVVFFIWVRQWIKSKDTIQGSLTPDAWTWHNASEIQAPFPLLLRDQSKRLSNLTYESLQIESLDHIRWFPAKRFDRVLAHLQVTYYGGCR